MAAEAWAALGLMLLMATWWSTEAIPIPATALLPIVLVPALGLGTVGEATEPYANPIIFLFLGGASHSGLRCSDGTCIAGSP
jgi:sodium-dependent dicarboxylate transporter 2/3/5